ncbi:MCE family protein [Aeromicrobium panaciterrae]|uniref:MCE family protein n=1 Tax=Aeromicrobium panaciterrae TaxID=363861 RepID=UPI0031D82D26
MKRLILALAAVLTLSACGTSASDLPLPGAKLSGPSYEVSAQIDDALNLAVGAPVKLNGVTVGRVRTVTAHDFTARITMDVRTSSPLHDGASIRLRSTTPLGELFVDVSDKTGGTPLADGDAIDASDSSAAPTVEDTLASASMLVNGGGLGQLQTIVREANEALGGREDTARELLDTLNRTTHSVNESSAEIDATLDALADASEVLRRRNATIDRALVDVAPAARVLSDNTDEITKMLQAVDGLSGTTTRVVRETRADLLTTLQEMGPVLDQLVSLQGDFGPGLNTLISFAKAIDKGVPGNYLNVYLRFQDSLALGMPNLPIVGDLGVPRLDISGDLIDKLLVPKALQDAVQPDLGLGALLESLGGGAR